MWKMCSSFIANKIFKAVHFGKSVYDVKYAILLSTGIAMKEPFCTAITLASLGKGVKLLVYPRTNSALEEVKEITIS